jgi:nickel superoxide dismutase
MFDARLPLGVFRRIRDGIRPPLPVYAHCDIPCGIYDPHEAQISALTVLRMDQLIAELPKPGAASKPEEWEKYSAQISRYMTVKEQHSERCKQELRILWADYFTADLAAKFPQVHETFFKALKAASKARQGTAVADAQDLLTQVGQVAELFWKSKDVKTQKVPSRSKAGGELVVPTA